jgi:hypothetical protein
MFELSFMLVCTTLAPSLPGKTIGSKANGAALSISSSSAFGF